MVDTTAFDTEAEARAFIEGALCADEWGIRRIVDTRIVHEGPRSWVVVLMLTDDVGAGAAACIDGYGRAE